MNLANPSEVDAFVEQRNALISHLQEERKRIIATYQQQLVELQKHRDERLHQNRQQLSKLGAEIEEIESEPTLQRVRTMTPQQIQTSLSQFMAPNMKYNSPMLCEHLGISYPTFKKFVERHPDFIEVVGLCKGTRYVLKNPNPADAFPVIEE